MIARLIPLLIACALAFPALADEAQDALVEQGIQAYDNLEYQKAKDILFPLAESGHPKAMNFIGLMHHDRFTLPGDPRKECDWYEKAAKAGYPPAMYNLSICFEHRKGRPQSREDMLKWRTMAAKQGQIDAMVNLAGEDDDYGEQYLYWMHEAIKHGSIYAKVILWLRGFRDDLPEIHFSEITCVYWHIVIQDRDRRYCDGSSE